MLWVFIHSLLNLVCTNYASLAIFNLPEYNYFNLYKRLLQAQQIWALSFAMEIVFMVFFLCYSLEIYHILINILYKLHLYKIDVNIYYFLE